MACKRQRASKQGKGRVAAREGETVKNVYWLTPPELYKKLDDEFHFDFDPCPYPEPEWDGLEVEWGKMNYVNPLFSQPTRWVRKALAELEKGKESVIVKPVSTSTYLLLEYQARRLGNVKWISYLDPTDSKASRYPIAAFILACPSSSYKKCTVSNEVK
jgi:hypothetical protein